MNKQVNKQQLVKLTSRELNGVVSYFDIFSVVNILINELKQDILTFKEINIPNFGKFIIKMFNPKIHKNVINGKLQLTKPYSALRFKLSRNILKQLMKMETCEKDAIK